MKILGKRLKEARTAARYTQMEAAKLLGISNGTLSGYERNYRDPDTEILDKMADLYDVSVEWLMGRSDISNPVSATPIFTEKEKSDMAKRIEEMTLDLKEGRAKGSALSFKGEPMSEEAVDSLIEALEHAERIATLTNRKFTPKKHRGE